MDTIRIGVAGSGGFLYSNPSLSASCFLAEQEGRITMLDAGYGTYSLARRLKGWNILDVSRIILTHPHGDHMGDAIVMVHGIQKLQEKFEGSIRTIEIYGPAGTKKMYRNCILLVGEPEYTPKIVVHEGPGRHGDIRLFPVTHGSKEALAAVLYGSREILYTGDLNAKPANLEAIIDASHEPHTIMSEATEPKNPWHIDISGAVNLMERGGFKQMYTMHTRRHHEAAVRRVAKKSGGRIIKCARGKTYTIP